jgi:hypothetical protein
VVTTQYVHRLVCEAFHGPPPFGLQCRHLNGKRADNRPDNLTWSTKIENESDKERHGTLLHADKAPWSKLSLDQVMIARQRAARGEEVLSIARELGVSYAALRDAVSGKKWRRVPGSVPVYSTRRKLTEDQVREIRQSNMTYVALGKRFGVSRNAIGQIVRRESYAHVV